jgi:hypothetical protein
VSTISIAEGTHVPMSGEGVPYGLAVPIQRLHNASAGIDPRQLIRYAFVWDAFPPAYATFGTVGRFRPPSCRRTSSHRPMPHFRRQNPLTPMQRADLRLDPRAGHAGVLYSAYLFRLPRFHNAGPQENEKEAAGISLPRSRKTRPSEHQNAQTEFRWLRTDNSAGGSAVLWENLQWRVLGSQNLQ